MKSLSKYQILGIALTLAAATGLFSIGFFINEREIETGEVALLMLAIIIIGSVIALVMSRKQSTAYKWAVRTALGTTFILFWLVGGVGVMGPDNHHPADILYLFVATVGMTGSILARFQADGMARAMFAAAITQMIVPFAALILGMHTAPFTAENIRGIVEIVILNGFFATLFSASAFLFLKDARKHTAPAMGNSNLPG